MMRQHLLLFSLIILCYYSCQSSNKPDVKNVSAYKLKINDDHRLVKTLYSNLELIYNDTLFSTDIKTISNLHSDVLIDTIITKAYKNTSIKKYKGNNKEIICKAHIADSDFNIMKYLKVGSKKHITEKSLGILASNDSIIVSNFEKTNVFIFKFKDHNLKTITLRP